VLDAFDGLRSDEIAFVGDRLLTDVVYAVSFVPLVC
jgi:predicted HAD superfamily phosphohydrolase YqeG